MLLYSLKSPASKFSYKWEVQESANYFFSYPNSSCALVRNENMHTGLLNFNLLFKEVPNSIDFLA